MHAVEAKSGATFAADFLDGLESWTALAGRTPGDRTLVYGGETAYTREEVGVIPWTRFAVSP